MSLAQIITHLFTVAPTLLPVLADAAAKSVAILAVTAFATIAMRRASAAARHLVWLLGLASLLGLPILSAALPAWHVLPAWAMPTPAQSASPPTMPPVAMETPIPQPIVAQSPAPLDEPPNNTAPQPPVIASPAPASPSALPPPPAATPGIHTSWQAWTFLAWAVGGSLLLAHILLGMTSLAWLGRRSDRITDADWITLLGDLSAQLGLRREVTLLASRHRTMPMVWGILRIRLLLPADATDWTGEQRRAVLLHELAHVKRNDCLWQLLAHFIRAVYWFNPLAWLACRQMQTEREMACDDLVLRGGARPSAYAEQLLRIAAAPPAPRDMGYPAAIAMARPSALEGRLLAILDAGRNRKTVTVASGVVAAVAALLVTSCVAVLFGTNPKPLGATVIFHADQDGRLLAKPSKPIPLDAPEAAELASFFPQMRQSNDRFGAWVEGAEIEFRYPNGRSAKVVVSANEDYGHWSEGRGDWEPHGDLAAFLNKLRPATAPALLEAPGHEPALGTQPGPTRSAEAAFGPVHDVTLYDPRSDKPAAINFDTGKTYALPAGAYLANYEKWLNGSDASVMVLLDYDHRILCVIRGTKINLHSIDSDAWNKLSADQVLALAAKPPYVRHEWFNALSIWPAPASPPVLPQTGLFQTPNGTVGLVQIVEADGATEFTGPSALARPKAPLTLKLRYTTVQMPPASPASIAAGFEPAREIILSAGDFLNLTTGTFVKTAIPEYKGMSPAQARQARLEFCRKNGIDVIDTDSPDQKISRLTGIDMALTPALENSLETMPAADARQAVAAGPIRSTGPIDMNYSPTYAFRTRDGQVGILEITPSAEKQITLRYKLARGEPLATQPTTAPANAGAPQISDHSALPRLRDAASSALLQQIQAQANYDAALRCKGDAEKLRQMAGPALVAQLDPQGQTLRSQRHDVELQIVLLKRKGYGDKAPLMVQDEALLDELNDQIKLADQAFARAYVKSLLAEKQRADDSVRLSEGALRAGLATPPASWPATQPDTGTVSLRPSESAAPPAAAIGAALRTVAVATLKINLLDGQNRPLRHQEISLLPATVGYSRATDDGPYWPDQDGTVTIPQLFAGEHRFVMEGWNPEVLDVNVPPEGLTVDLRATPVQEPRPRPEVSPRVTVERKGADYLLHVAISNSTDQPYTLTDDDLRLWSRDYVIRLPKEKSHAGEVVPAKGKGKLELTLDWNGYANKGLWFRLNDDTDVKGPLGSAGPGLEYYRMDAGISSSLPFVLPAPAGTPVSPRYDGPVPATAPATQPAANASIDITKLPNADLDRIAHGVSATLNAARRLTDFDGNHIPRDCWAPAIAALRPLEVEERQGNVRIVLSMRDGTSSGLLGVPMTSSTIPESGADETVMPLIKGDSGFLRAVPAESPDKSRTIADSSLYVFRSTAPAPATRPAAARHPAESGIDVAGQVIDDVTGKPIENFVIQSGGPDPKDAGKVEWGGEQWGGAGWAGGRFGISEDRPAGEKLWFRVLAPGYRPQPITAEPMTAPATAEGLVIRLRRGIDLHGQVLDSSGHAVAKAAVFLAGPQDLWLKNGEAQDSYARSKTTTDTAGRFVLPVTGNATDRVVVSCPAMAAWIASVADPTKELTIRLPVPATLRFRYDIAGGPDPGEIYVALETAKDPAWRGVRAEQTVDCRDGGSTALGNLAPGTYYIARWHRLRIGDAGGDYLSDRTQVTLKAGESQSVDFVRAIGQPVTGTMSGLEKTGIPGAIVMVFGGNVSGDPRGEIGSNYPLYDALKCAVGQTFKTERLSPGTYTVVGEAYGPDNGELGIRLPMLIAKATVVVPEKGQLQPVRLIFKPLPNRAVKAK